MKVIVKASGFFGGVWFDASDKEQEMPDAVARAFLPPYGDQIARADAAPAAIKPAALPKPSPDKDKG